MHINRIYQGIIILILFCFVIGSCSSPGENEKKVPVVGFLDFIEDPTVALAREGFFDALRQAGYSEEDTTLVVHYANAQGDIPVLNQSCDFILSKKPDLIATNVTLSTITAIKRERQIPVFMMVSPRPDIAGLADSAGKYPANLSGVYETLSYIDSAVNIIKELRPNTKRLGTVYNQSEPQSRDAFNTVLKKCNSLGIELVSLPVNNSSETQLVTESLLSRKIDAFFALPDNVIFASFETIVSACDKAGVPVFTSEAGLVSRGAVASFGADFYQWGFQSGRLAAQYLKGGKKQIPAPEIVSVRRKLFNPKTAARYGIVPDSTFTSISPDR